MVTTEKGEVCLKHGCSLCCQDTKMPLTNQDIDRLHDLGYDSKDLITRACGEKRLRNIHGKCFFLRDNRCVVYPDRPEGCRTYPLVFHKEKRKAEMDRDCPHHEQFHWSKEDVKKLKKVIRTIEKERS
jgi:Fe-S-cluster containining protein